MSKIQEFQHLKIPLEYILLATNNFSEDNFIGRGGFGRVYKGLLSISGKPATTVAVKRLDVKGGQGEKEFLMEIMTLSSYKHNNLVSLVGFSEDEQNDQKFIVYEFVIRGSLDKYLATTDLTWVQRLHICLGAARGLEYLHNGVGVGHRVLHRDIKSSNILLDENWEAKISDFGLAKIGLTNEEFTFVVTNAAGTMEYVDPVFVKTGVVRKESDVYSFGVVLFEILCGKPAVIENPQEKQLLCHLAEVCYEEGRLDDIIAPNLRKQMKVESLKKFSRIAYQCLKLDPKQRPKIGSIINELQISLEHQIGSQSQKFTRIGYWGSGTDGNEWSFYVYSDKKLKKIKIDHKDWIYSLTLTIEDFGGSLHSSPRLGGTSGVSHGEISEIIFDVDEEVIGIFGTEGITTGSNAGLEVISSLSFVTNKRTYGPFGSDEIGTPFSVQWHVGSFAGFFGRAGIYLHSLGCYLRAVIIEY